MKALSVAQVIPDQDYSVAQVAQILGVSKNTIYRLIETGWLKDSYKINPDNPKSDWRIPGRSIIDYRKRAHRASCPAPPVPGLAPACITRGRRDRNDIEYWKRRYKDKLKGVKTKAKAPEDIEAWVMKELAKDNGEAGL